jgi:hypothetical protein
VIAGVGAVALIGLTGPVGLAVVVVGGIAGSYVGGAAGQSVALDLYHSINGY